MDAYGVKVMSGQVCLTCKGKLESIPSYQFLTPTQIRDVIAGRLSHEEAAKEVSQKFAGAPAQPVAAAPSAADEIRQFKSLLDEGIITPEEFEQAKSRILNR